MALSAGLLTGACRLLDLRFGNNRKSPVGAPKEKNEPGQYRTYGALSIASVIVG